MQVLQGQLPKAAPKDQLAIIDELVTIFEANKTELGFVRVFKIDLDKVVESLKVERAKIEASLK